MRLPERSIKGHVPAVILNDVPVLSSVVAYPHIGMDKLPHARFPVISVLATLNGTSPGALDACDLGTGQPGRPRRCSIQATWK